MKLLIMTGPLFPQPGNNANLIGKLIPYFLAAGHEVHLFSSAFGKNESKLPKDSFGVPVHWATDQNHDLKRRLIIPAVSKVTDPNGFSDALQVQILQRELKDVYRKYPFEMVLSTSEPYPMACVASQFHSGKKVLYIMDPPACVSNGTETAYRNRTLSSMLKNQNALITTPFIMEALKKHNIHLPSRNKAVGFPIISKNQVEGKNQDDGRIRLLFCGWLYSRIRSPKYFLDIVSRLDERFEVVFMGRECDKLQDHYPIDTKATIITLPNQPYSVALQAMASADVLINIGNNVPVHMPSKTLEYINTGKPMVNFYKRIECPTLFYTKRYPLAMNMFEGDSKLDVATAQFVRFCEENVGKEVDRSLLEQKYEDCTPKYIAEQICKLFM